MPSLAHQFIADNIARRMNIDGYAVVSYDGIKEYQDVKLRMPPKIKRHRPDLIGISNDGEISIGEAKTAEDFTAHTSEQILDFFSSGFKLYVGVPLSARQKL